MKQTYKKYFDVFVFVLILAMIIRQMHFLHSIVEPECGYTAVCLTAESNQDIHHNCIYA